MITLDASSVLVSIMSEIICEEHAAHRDEKRGPIHHARGFGSWADAAKDGGLIGVQFHRDPMRRVCPTSLTASPANNPARSSNSPDEGDREPVCVIGRYQEKSQQATGCEELGAL
jgi:hypothetical protein